MTKILALFLLITWPSDINDISKVNSLKKQAAQAFQSGNFEKAAEHYSYLLDTLQVDDERAMMNLANSYYQLGDADLAQNQYAKLTLSEDKELKSAAYQQLGALSKDPKTLEKALSYFKESIKSDPSNEDSRYNYELVKKKLKEQQEQQQNQDQQNEDQNKDQDQKDQENQDQDKQNQDQQNQDQQNQDQQNQDQQNKDQQQQDQEKQDQQDQQQQENKDQGKEEQQQQEQGDEKQEEKSPQQQTADKLKEMNISEEKARMILEALKNNEVQYIQQNRRKPTKKKETGKPDW